MVVVAGLEHDGAPGGINNPRGETFVGPRNLAPSVPSMGGGRPTFPPPALLDRASAADQRRQRPVAESRVRRRRQAPRRCRASSSYPCMGSPRCTSALSAAAPQQPGAPTGVPPTGVRQFPRAPAGAAERHRAASAANAPRPPPSPPVKDGL